MFDLPLSGNVELINIGVEQWDYYRCDLAKQMYYDCIATKIANLPFKKSPNRCIPIEYHGLFQSIGSNLSRCSTYNENLQIMNEISIQYLLRSISNILLPIESFKHPWYLKVQNFILLS